MRLRHSPNSESSRHPIARLYPDRGIDAIVSYASQNVAESTFPAGASPRMERKDAFLLQLARSAAARRRHLMVL
jgi:hypothetical protein